MEAPPPPPALPSRRSFSGRRGQASASPDADEPVVLSVTSARGSVPHAIAISDPATPASPLPTVADVTDERALASTFSSRAPESAGLRERRSHSLTDPEQMQPLALHRSTTEPMRASGRSAISSSGEHSRPRRTTQILQAQTRDELRGALQDLSASVRADLDHVLCRNGSLLSMPSTHPTSPQGGASPSSCGSRSRSGSILEQLRQLEELKQMVAAREEEILECVKLGEGMLGELAATEAALRDERDASAALREEIHELREEVSTMKTKEHSVVQESRADKVAATKALEVLAVERMSIEAERRALREQHENLQWEKQESAAASRMYFRASCEVEATKLFLSEAEGRAAAEARFRFELASGCMTAFGRLWEAARAEHGRAAARIQSQGELSDQRRAEADSLRSALDAARSEADAHGRILQQAVREADALRAQVTEAEARAAAQLESERGAVEAVRRECEERLAKAEASCEGLRQQAEAAAASAHAHAENTARAEALCRETQAELEAERKARTDEQTELQRCMQSVRDSADVSACEAATVTGQLEAVSKRCREAEAALARSKAQLDTQSAAQVQSERASEELRTALTAARSEVERRDQLLAELEKERESEAQVSKEDLRQLHEQVRAAGNQAAELARERERDAEASRTFRAAAEQERARLSAALERAQTAAQDAEARESGVREEIRQAAGEWGAEEARWRERERSREEEHAKSLRAAAETARGLRSELRAADQRLREAAVAAAAELEAAREGTERAEELHQRTREELVSLREHEESLRSAARSHAAVEAQLRDDVTRLREQRKSDAEVVAELRAAGAAADERWRSMQRGADETEQESALRGAEVVRLRGALAEKEAVIDRLSAENRGMRAERGGLQEGAARAAALDGEMQKLRRDSEAAWREAEELRAQLPGLTDRAERGIALGDRVQRLEAELSRAAERLQDSEAAAAAASAAERTAADSCRVLASERDEARREARDLKWRLRQLDQTAQLSLLEKLNNDYESKLAVYKDSIGSLSIVSGSPPRVPSPRAMKLSRLRERLAHLNDEVSAVQGDHRVLEQELRRDNAGMLSSVHRARTPPPSSRGYSSMHGAYSDSWTHSEPDRLSPRRPPPTSPAPGTG
eukprot:TRINITY_DN36360_c0_g1_i1.p1 TRINITY_DN36360_c0_g1~~TRINITY_DN36360_c0_g1_i1.p1  ORF type:complete len:1118 (+),score=414.75 TRINITY_DN36360_c0_g1_i1:50-3403(+)